MSTFLRSTETRNHKADLEFLRSHFVPRCQTWHRNASNIQVWECPSGRRANFISIRQTSSGIFQIFQIFSVINSNYVFSRPWRYSQRYWAWGTSSKPVRKLAPPKRTGISAHGFFFFLTCHSLIHLHAAKCEF